MSRPTKQGCSNPECEGFTCSGGTWLPPPAAGTPALQTRRWDPEMRSAAWEKLLLAQGEPLAFLALHPRQRSWPSCCSFPFSSVPLNPEVPLHSGSCSHATADLPCPSAQAAVRNPSKLLFSNRLFHKRFILKLDIYNIFGRGEMFESVWASSWAVFGWCLKPLSPNSVPGLEWSLVLAAPFSTGPEQSCPQVPCCDTLRNRVDTGSAKTCKV